MSFKIYKSILCKGLYLNRGSSRSDNGDSKKAIGLVGKMTTSLHIHHTWRHISMPSLHGIWSEIFQSGKLFLAPEQSKKKTCFSTSFMEHSDTIMKFLFPSNCRCRVRKNSVQFLEVLSTLDNKWASWGESREVLKDTNSSWFYKCCFC